MSQLSIFPEVVDEKTLSKAIACLREVGVSLPTLSQLANPATIPQRQLDALAVTKTGEPDPADLWRVHWFNDAAGSGLTDVPGYLVMPEALTGVKAKIIVALGNRFPMIGAHKVLAAYGCLVPRLVTGRFDPRKHKAVWPSTGNYCRGGVAISRIIGCRSIAVLPAGMSQERFDWLERWVSHPEDIVRTPGTESNVKEIYDACASLAAAPDNVILNQFSEFSNYIVHYHCTGQAMDRVFTDVQRNAPALRLAAFVSATGSAGTIASGDYLKQRHGARIAAVEATECPTMLCNGYGEHNIQGIGDKHIPLIHNVMNTDVAIGVSDRGSDALNLLFNSDAGKHYLPTAKNSIRSWSARWRASAFQAAPTSSRQSRWRSTLTSEQMMPSSPWPPTAQPCTPASVRTICSAITQTGSTKSMQVKFLRAIWAASKTTT